MKYKKMAIQILLLAMGLSMLSACDPRYGFLESEFKLAEESRLPKWLNLSQAQKRSKIDVILRFYTLEKAKIFVVDKASGDQLGNTIVANLHWTEETKKKGFVAKPSYFVLTVDGIEELFEQRALEPKLYVSGINGVRL
ncbi:MAG: hypothetical protein ACKE9I_08585 [Methylophagaceae bacterium]